MIAGVIPAWRIIMETFVQRMEKQDLGGIQAMDPFPRIVMPRGMRLMRVELADLNDSNSFDTGNPLL